MQLVRLSFINKTNVLSSVARNTSCSRGWLRLVVQTIFAIITVASFILIVIMAISNADPFPRPENSSRCRAIACKVSCRDAPFYGLYEYDVIDAVAVAESYCPRIVLELTRPAFVNGTLPKSWLSEMRSDIHELTISQGNLMHIPHFAFISPFAGTVRKLILRDLTIRTWLSNSFVGLYSLRKLSIIDCNIANMGSRALRAVDETLETLNMTRNAYWNPARVTGSPGLRKLTTVDFSYNSFHDLLGRNSFTGLKYCKVLHLNSCHITNIRNGAFDNLKHIEVIYLNDNHLITISPALFNNIISLVNPTPRISLQNNPWHCDCSSEGLRYLINTNLLYIDPICVYPREMNGKTFSEFEYSCKNESSKASDSYSASYRYASNYAYNVVGKYCQSNNNSENDSVQLFSPFWNNKCSSSEFKNINLSVFTSKAADYIMSTESNWLKFTFFIQTDIYSVMQIDSLKSDEYGLLWYQSTCPYEINCVNILPCLMRVYNVDLNASYTFCPVMLNSGIIDIENCIGYDMSTYRSSVPHYKFNLFFYILTGFVCLIFGAVCVYGIIRANPYLLKGSKRILFVKHKTVDALVLPPKVPLRNDLINEPVMHDQKIFTIPCHNKLMPPRKMNRIKSIRSDKSSASYISALQPTEDQLAEWRIRHHFNNELTICSTKSELSTLSWLCNDSLYCSIDVDSNINNEGLE